MYLTQEQLDRYTQTIRKAADWARDNAEQLLTQKDMQGYYKGPYAWASVGDMKMAGIYRRLIEERFLREDGDFRAEPDAKGFYKFSCTVANHYIYSNGWLICGLQKLGAYDMVRRALEFVLRFQDPTHGGFYSFFDARMKTIDKTLMDSSSTSSAAMALLACGRIEQARQAGDFILRLLDLQPQPDKYYFACMKADGSLHTDVFADENAWAADGRKQMCLSAEADASGELTWLIGKPTKFLTRLYSATGDDKYLDGAIRAFDFFHKLQENAWTNYASCKTMWAGAELYRLTGEERFAETAVRLLDFYCETQSPDGGWVHKLWYKDSSDQTLEWSADIVLEYMGEFS
ncbi:MAG: hypothetical protein JXM70_25905, partial [Pirellulales bacterium]|nr:hypothetical protein [Pirellulales bacterium]